MADGPSSKILESRKQVLDRAGNAMKSAQAIEILTDYLTVEDVPTEADAAFVFGGASLSPAQRTAELYFSGCLGPIFCLANRGRVSNPEWSLPESRIFFEEMVRLGVPRDTIYHEALCTNTLEESKAAVPYMRRHGVDPERIFLVARPLHQRRAAATFSKANPGIDTLNAPGREVPQSAEEWSHMIHGEMCRLRDYAEKGGLCAQPMDQEILSAWATLRETVR